MNDTIIVRPLKPHRLDDFLAFFDHEAFADNQDWSECYCQCYYIDHTKVKWSERTGEQNRAQACELAKSGAMQGYLAYIDDKPVGWCNAAPWKLVTALHDEPDPDSSKLGEIICFIVAKPYRSRGVATTLLNAACEGLRAEGMTMVEAFARPEAKSDAESYHGPLSMYEAAGFTVHRKSDDGGVWLRKLLV